MPATRRRFSIAAALAGATACAALVPRAHAQSGTVRIVVGFPAGATSDALARLVAEHMQRTLKQPVIVENKVGAGGRIANELVKASPADGGTLLMTPVATMAIFPHSYAGQLRYDPIKDFAPVAHLSSFQIGWGTAATAPVSTLADYVAWVKADPAKNGFYASAAPGSIPHFFGVMFAKSAGLSLTHVPYKGTAAAMTAVAGGEVSAISTVAADIRALVSGGKARLLAVAGEQRDESFPDVPTFRELGYNWVDGAYRGIGVPKSTTPAVRKQVSDMMDAINKDPEMRKKMTEQGFEVTDITVEMMPAFMKERTPEYMKSAKMLGLAK